MRKSSAISAVLKLKLLLSLTVLLLATDVSAQKSEHYNSPLYAPKKYDPNLTSSNGLPKVLQEVGIEQKLGGQLPLLMQPDLIQHPAEIDETADCVVWTAKTGNIHAGIFVAATPSSQHVSCGTLAARRLRGESARQ